VPQDGFGAADPKNVAVGAVGFDEDAAGFTDCGKCRNFVGLPLGGVSCQTYLGCRSALVPV
jgi:hypothetical protein